MNEAETRAELIDPKLKQAGLKSRKRVFCKKRLEGSYQLIIDNYQLKRK